MIYLIADKKKQWCKVGYSISPMDRVKELQVGMPMDLEVLRIIEGSIGEEKKLHNKFKEHHIRGEWFKYHTDITSYIESKPHIEVIRRNRVSAKKPSVKDYKFHSTNPLIGIAAKLEKPLTDACNTIMRYAMDKSNIHESKFWLPKEIEGIGRTTVWRGVLQLLEAGIIAKADTEGCYFVNPTIAFKGDRITLVKQYIMEKDKSQLG